MARIDDAGLVCWCIEKKAGVITRICMQKPNPKVHPEGGRGRKMARIDNTKLVCCCIWVESWSHTKHMHTKTKPLGAPKKPEM